MSRAFIVYMSLGRLLLHPPGIVVFHAIDRRRSEWPHYVPDPDQPGFSLPIPEGRERHQTLCGQLIYVWWHENGQRVGERGLDGVRADVAKLIGRPCRRCFA